MTEIEINRRALALGDGREVIADIKSTVTLEGEVVESIPAPDYLTSYRGKANAREFRITRVSLRYWYDLVDDCWKFSTGSAWAYRIKNDGTLYANASTFTIWRAEYADGIFDELIDEWLPTEKLRVEVVS